MKKEKNKKSNRIIWIVDIIAICLIILILYFLRTNMSIEFPWDKYTAKARVVVVRVDEHSMLVQGIEGSSVASGLNYLGFTKKGNIGYKVGQELLVYYDGYMLMTYPGRFANVGKIKIIKEKSDVEISQDTLRFAYSSKDKVFALLSDFTNAGLTLTIIDRNEEYPYDYSSSDYSIQKTVKNPNYTGEPGYYDGEATSNSTPAYIAPAPEYISKSITEGLEDRIENTVKTQAVDSQDDISKFKATRKIINWKDLLGELGERRIFFYFFR